MSANKLYITMIVLLGACALIAGCGDETVAPPVAEEAPILPPQNFVSDVRNSSVVLTWDANTQGHLLGYNVYRSDGGQLDVITLLTPTPITETMYVDSDVAPGAYRYRVTSVSRIHKESQHVIVDTVVNPNTPRIDREGKKFQF